MARCVLPVPVPPTTTTLRLVVQELAAAEVAHQTFVDRVPSKANSAEVLGQGQLAIVIW